MLEEKIIDLKPTLGQQIIDNQTKYAGQFTQTVRETTDEMGKKYMDELVKCAQDNLAKADKDFYIVEVLERDKIFDCVLKAHFHARWTKPIPEWGLALYKVDYKTGNLIYVWGLPAKHEAWFIMHNPQGFEAKTVQDIVDFLDGKL